MRILLMIAVILFLNSSTVNLFAQCEEIRKNVHYKDLGEPVLEGKPTLIPEIKLKITKRNTGEILPSEEVYLFYKWEHFLVSHKYNTDGVLTDSSDVIVCTTNFDGIVYFPEYNLIPIGWYDGPKIRSLLRGKRLPKFLEIEIFAANYHFGITKSQLKMIRDNKVKKPIVLKGPSGFVGQIKVEIIP